MEAQHTAYRQIRSVFRIVSTPITDFGSITPNKLYICSPWLESIWKHNAQHIAELGQYLFGIASVFGIEVQIEIGQYLGLVGQCLVLKLSRSIFGIEVEIEIDRV